MTERTPEQQAVIEALRARDDFNATLSASGVAAKAIAVEKAVDHYHKAKSEEVQVLKDIHERKLEAEAKLKSAVDNMASIFLDLYKALPKDAQNKVRHHMNNNL